ncbi:MAG: ImmA/IrrE family metallo-endopeptidase [Prochloraceae cyanobacterium]|nr:ImmA/IrrE family metallo-endopeptidase [Prochloraceae cyanobacterium]
MSIFRTFKKLHKEEIEAQATKIIRRMKLSQHYIPKWPLDASRVAEFLGLDVVWDSIGDDEIGTIAARIFPLQRLIEINSDIPKLRGTIAELTIAHEIGHWVLHVNPVAVNRFLKLRKRGVDVKPVDPLFCRGSNAELEIEWQADYFASCLLMPKYILEEKQKQQDLTQPGNLNQIAEEIGVNRSDLFHRLQDLDLLPVSSF